MPVVEVELGKRHYQLACEEGQEEHLKSLAVGLNIRLDELSGLTDSASDNMILVMTSLMMQDELNELKKQALEKGPRAKKTADMPAASSEEIDAAVSDAINVIASYVETVADRIEKQ